MPRKTMSKQSEKAGPKRRRFTAEYKAEVVRLSAVAGKSPYEVALELGLSPSVVSRWVKQAKIDAGGGGQGPLTSAERDELARLRRENKTLRQERDILRKATAFFAKEGMS